MDEREMERSISDVIGEAIRSIERAEELLRKSNRLLREIERSQGGGPKPYRGGPKPYHLEDIERAKRPKGTTIKELNNGND